MSAGPLSPTEIDRRLESLPGWTLEGDRITRTFRLPSHFAAAALTVHIARIQDELNHHSDLTLGYNTVALSVHTHDAGGAVTEKDLALAARVAS
ncbi:4a-hydroxytetrahydrobiopterin dehydratase, partial [Streptomyces sp. SID7499]|nr:4a-hydroxytetrahydrobiopterin dehydratase [Streptomyces sp. SID7499]